MTTKLTLKVEHLTALTDADLAGVVGAQATLVCLPPSVNPNQCNTLLC